MRTAIPLFCLALLLAALPCRAADAAPPAKAEVIIDNATSPSTPAPLPVGVTVTFRSETPGHLFRAARAIDLTAVITSEVAQPATINTRVTTLYGAEVYRGSVQRELPEREAVTLPVTFPDAKRLPDGAYLVEVWVLGTQRAGAGTTPLNVWSGPLTTPVDSFGISYAGPLAGERIRHDLDLFRMAGVGWLRFPLQGWLPQGQIAPPEAEVYNTLVQEAARRDFNMLASFTPKLTVDPGVNGVQASKEYRESLLAAVTRYGFKVKDWELLTVRPDPRYPELSGVRFKELAEYAKSFKAMDKSLRGVYTVDHPFKWNALEMFSEGLPGKGDAFAMRYNYVGIPEIKADSTPPVYAMDDVMPSMRKAFKDTPPVWVTELGFDAQLRERLPDPGMQGALMARALLLNRAANFQRTFWRHDPAAVWETPFTDARGNAQPNLLALRTTLERLNGVTQVLDVPSPMLVSEAMPRRVWALLLRYEEPSKGRKKKARHVLATWWETRDHRVATSISIRTSAQRVTVTDLWGNSVELQPTSNTAVITVDAFPRFVDLGEANDVEIYSPFARFDPSAVILTEDGANYMGLELHNDQRLFRDKITCDVYFRRWPGEGEVQSQKIELGPADSTTIARPLRVPEGAKKGQLYEMSAEIMLGTRRIGYLTMPVTYVPKSELPQPPALPK